MITDDQVHAFQDIQQEVWQVAEDKGFHNDSAYSVDKKLMLIVGEIAEAHEEIRAGHDTVDVYVKDGKLEGFGVELADTVIRIMDLAESEGIDLAQLISSKHEYNKTRPYLHGKKF